MTAPEGDPGGILRFADFRRTVADVGRAIDFYVGALGFVQDVERSGGPARLRLGHETIELIDARTAGVGGGSEPLDVAALPFQHIAVVTCDMAASAARLARWAPTPISRDGPVRLPAGAGGVTAYKFRDRDGHPVELLEFPAGGGDRRWHPGRPGKDDRHVNLGIDHSAIGIADVERSLAFYVEGLGLSVASRHRNHGDAQSRLDGLSDSVVDVVGLRPSAQRTPHLELLGRRPPRPRPRSADAPIDRDPADCIVFIVDDLRAVRRRLAGAIDAACTTLAASSSNPTRAIRTVDAAQAAGSAHDAASRVHAPTFGDRDESAWRLRDPDGHLIEVGQRIDR